MGSIEATLTPSSSICLAHIDGSNRSVMIVLKMTFNWLVGCLLGFCGISTFVDCLTPNPVYTFAQSAGAVEDTDCFSAECHGYDTKQSDGAVPAVLELWGMRSTPSLPLLLGPLWPRVVAPDRALSMG